jgi:hypothetical protein
MSIRVARIQIVLKNTVQNRTCNVMTDQTLNEYPNNKPYGLQNQLKYLWYQIPLCSIRLFSWFTDIIKHIVTPVT